MSSSMYARVVKGTGLRSVAGNARRFEPCYMHKYKKHACVPEWSKGAGSSPAVEKRAGSNPATCIFFNLFIKYLLSIN